MRKLVLLSGALSLAGCSSLTPTTDPVYLRINDIEARLIRIERVLDNDSIITLAQDVQALRTEVQSLTGQIEELDHALQDQGDRQRDLYVDLDQRLSDLEAAQSRLESLGVGGGQIGGGQISGGQAGGGQLGGVALTDQQAYDAAFGLIQQQNFPAAQTAFENFLATYPTSERRSNAQYWLAESLYAQLEFRAALAEFQRVLDDYPQSSKYADAMLKVGYSYYELGELDQARQVLQRVVREFPNSSDASSADQRLQRIADERR